jgi:phosphatidyl-myo-inositol dimannoside synthase
VKLLVVTHYYVEHGGGVEMVAWELVRRLIGQGAEVTWAASAPASNPCLRGLSLLPMRSSNILEERSGIPYPIWSPRSIVALFKAIRQCDVLHLHDSLYMGNLVAYAHATSLRKPIIVTQHVGNIPYSQPIPRYLLRFANATLARWVLSGSTRTVFCSDKVLRFFSRQVRFRTKPAHIGNGVDADLFTPVTGNERLKLRARFGCASHRPLLLFVGRFVEKKGLRVIRELAVKFPDCTWALAGAGPIKPCNWGLPQIHEFGWVDQGILRVLYQAADLLVLPSVGEGFPLVVQEAMACGTPVVISDDTAAGWPGVERLAFVCEPRVDKMATLLSELLAAPATFERRRPAVAAYARSQWNWDECASQYLDVFREVTPRCAVQDDPILSSGADYAECAAQPSLVAPCAAHAGCPARRGP